jgi:hypothetical protein
MPALSTSGTPQDFDRWWFKNLLSINLIKMDLVLIHDPMSWRNVVQCRRRRVVCEIRSIRQVLALLKKRWSRPTLIS